MIYNPEEIIEIPDPVLKKTIQECLGIGTREITRSDAKRLVYLRNANSDDTDTINKIKTLTGLSAFTELTGQLKVLD